MKPIRELARTARLQDAARDRGRVSEAQWQMQNVAMFQLGLALGLFVHARARRGNWPEVLGCHVPADWKPVDPIIATEYGSPLGGDYLRHCRRERQIAAARALDAQRQRDAAEVKRKSTGTGAIVDTLRTERFIAAATGKS
jgi:hypothetical protein